MMEKCVEAIYHWRKRPEAEVSSIVFFPFVAWGQRSFKMGKLLVSFYNLIGITHGSDCVIFGRLKRYLCVNPG